MWLRRLAVAAAVIVLAIGALLALAMGRPGWYQPPDAAVVMAQSETLENAVATQLTLPRREGGGEWSVSVSEADANAWLAARLGKWSESRGIQWPRGVSGVQVRFQAGVCTLAAMVEVAGASRCVSVEMVPRIEADGSLAVVAQGASIGRLAVPVDAALAALGRVGGGEKIRAMLTGEKPVMTQPIVKLEDGRRVRLLDLQALAGRVEVRCRTEVRP